ncbi:hypothetical protein PE067_13595 [Paracoccus sp. DMF-8]|uniref:hypothetical protein n=1 Tax=Paracoccus sp. DMF-8 TaxID=3019445 RepID=UPI0023E8D486|nr:hypothetical protein [Paracoccus sp. DMF-8]MDF3607073.1 hypothetical protein [Paracoccus sp. DMF-8]
MAEFGGFGKGRKSRGTGLVDHANQPLFRPDAVGRIAERCTAQRLIRRVSSVRRDCWSIAKSSGESPFFSSSAP